MAFHGWNGVVLPATRDFQATGSLASTCASRLCNLLHPCTIRTSTYSAYNWSIQGRMRDLEGQRQRNLAGSLVRANEVASPNHALSSSSVPSQTNVHPSQRNVHVSVRTAPLARRTLRLRSWFRPRRVAWSPRRLASRLAQGRADCRWAWGHRNASPLTQQSQHA